MAVIEGPLYAECASWPGSPSARADAGQEVSTNGRAHMNQATQLSSWLRNHRGHSFSHKSLRMA